MEVLDLGLVAFREAWEVQSRRRADLLAGRADEAVFAVEHPPVLTLGRGAEEGDAGPSEASWAAWGVEVVRVDRGGRATWHGPGQAVVYPVVDLRRRGRDVRAYVRRLEDAGAAAARRFGVEARPGREPVGVFVGAEKLASIGVSVCRWVTGHGIALNVTNDLGAFGRFTPCGLSGVRMTRLGDHAAVGADEARAVLAEEVAVRLEAAAGLPG